MDLDFLFNPHSVAVIGASNKEGKWGFGLLRNIITGGFEGGIYPVNPKGGKIQGKRAYKSILDIEEPVDLAVIGIPAQAIPNTLKDCASKRVKGVVVGTAGFAEIGQQGKELEEEISAIVQKSDMRMVGPNCIGILNSSASLNATMLASFTRGNVAFLSQSGNLSVDIEFVIRKRGLGFSKLVSFGNQTDIQFPEYIEYVGNDPHTKVIMLYIEQVKDGKTFMNAIKRTNKPIVAVKVGQTETGMRAAKSHTGSLAGSYSVYKAAFKQLGIINASDSNELVDLAEAFSKLPPMKNNRIAILTDGGGHAAIACDAAEKLGLRVPLLSHETQNKLKEILFPQSITLNPVDFAGAAEANLWSFIKCSDVILQDSKMDGLLIVGSLFGGYQTLFGIEESLEVSVAHGLCEVAGKYGKPMIIHCPYLVEEVTALQALRKGGIPVHSRIEAAAKCMAALADYGVYLEKIKGE